MKKVYQLGFYIMVILGCSNSIFAASVTQKIENTAKGVGDAILQGPKDMAAGLHKMFSPSSNRKSRFEKAYNNLKEERDKLLDPKYDDKYKNRKNIPDMIYAVCNDIVDAIIPMFEGSSDKAKKLKNHVAEQKKKIESIRWKAFKKGDYTEVADIVSNLMAYFKNEFNTWSSK